jgi:hypothetical protein
VRPVVACDLDSTLIYSRRTAEVDVTGLRCVEYRDGDASAFMTHRAAELLGELCHVAEVVPVTTRTTAQLARVRLPARIRFAVAANGAHLLDGGRADPSWMRAVHGRLRNTTRAEAWRRACALAAITGGRARLVDDLFCLVVAPQPLSGELVVAETSWGEPSGWRFSVQGRKAYWVPTGLTKGAAVVEVARRCGAGTVLAAGDSRLDADLFDVAVAGVRPAHGELHIDGWSAPHVAVTAATGARAGEEIVSWLLDRASSVGRATRPTATAAAADQ